MSSTIAILGAGELGGTVAQALALRDCVGRIVLIDAAAGVAAGKALDLQQSAAVDRFHTRLTGTDDLSAVTGARLCIVADRAGSPPAEWEGEDGLVVLGRVLQYGSGTPVVFAGARQSSGTGDLILRGARDLGAARERLIGSAPEALASALRALVALEAECSPSEVGLSVLGAPGGGFVVAWSEAAIGGHAIDRVLSQAQLARLEVRCDRVWPPGSYTLGAAAARVAEAILRSGRRHVNVLTLLSGEFGVRDRVGTLPVLLGPGGIARIRVPSLSPRERVQLESALRR